MNLAIDDSLESLDQPGISGSFDSVARPTRGEGGTYQLRFPISVVKACGRSVRASGLTLEMSSRRLLFTSDLPAKVGDLLEYVILLPGQRRRQAVRLRSAGAVLRTEAWKSPEGRYGSKWRILATIDSYRFERQDEVTHKGWSRTVPRRQQSASRGMVEDLSAHQIPRPNSVLAHTESPADPRAADASPCSTVQSGARASNLQVISRL